GRLSIVTPVVTKKSSNTEERSKMASVIEVYDASALVGLRTHVHRVAIERVDTNGETTIELPKLPELLAAAAVIRCLMPVRLRGSELKAIRRIMHMTLPDLEKKFDERTDVEPM